MAACNYEATYIDAKGKTRVRRVYARYKHEAKQLAGAAKRKVVSVIKQAPANQTG